MRYLSQSSRFGQRSLRTSYYRGGTSRALFFHRSDLPSDKRTWPSIFRSVLGSPDPNGRQLDGMGGGISSLSKICIAGPTEGRDRERAEIEYTMVAVGVRDGKVDFSGNCGNISAAVGPWAWDEDLVSKQEDVNAPGTKVKTVLLLNGNTNKVIRSTFELAPANAVQTTGSLSLPGVAGTGSPIRLDFLDPAGSKTGSLLPTGHVQETIDGVSVSCIDAGNPAVFISTHSLTPDASILPEAIEQDQTLCARLEHIRQIAAQRMGLASDDGTLPSAIPKICLVASPQDAPTISGEMLRQADMDVLARAMSMGQPHRAIPITVALCLAVTAKVEGTVVDECIRTARGNPVKDGVLAIAHPSGTMEVGAKVDGSEVECATLYRTARRIMNGKVFWTDSSAEQ